MCHKLPYSTILRPPLAALRKLCDEPKSNQNPTKISKCVDAVLFTGLPALKQRTANTCLFQIRSCPVASTCKLDHLQRAFPILPLNSSDSMYAAIFSSSKFSDLHKARFCLVLTWKHGNVAVPTKHNSDPWSSLAICMSGTLAFAKNCCNSSAF